MKPKEIQELIDFIAQSGLDEVNIETDQFKINVKRNSSNPAKPVDPVLPAVVPAPVLPALIPSTSGISQSPIPGQANNSPTSYFTVRSPMIGTFYRSASPDNPPLVSIGDEVKKGQMVCIIEAMKLFNEIESEVAGKVVKVLVENASPVEYDQPLFLVEPA
ncbi:MAG: acetyl-CoA carboxylase biotin carboxyl carrier protein [Ferruginibacter sp.]|nr:acetyl-CoA carboxylase biotin carboxyl carrier protein [Cytophagales bacterium]